MKRITIFLLALVSLIMGCGPRYAGGISGSYANADRETFTEVVTQRDRQGSLLFVIAWTSKGGETSATRTDRNLVTRINDKPVHPDLDRQAVYAFQPDGSLKQLALTNRLLKKACFEKMTLKIIGVFA